jgi:hypothetical protein
LLRELADGIESLGVGMFLAAPFALNCVYREVERNSPLIGCRIEATMEDSELYFYRGHASDRMSFLQGGPEDPLANRVHGAAIEPEPDRAEDGNFIRLSRLVDRNFDQHAALDSIHASFASVPGLDAMEHFRRRDVAGPIDGEELQRE